MYFEDIEVRERHVSEQEAISEDEIIAFAREWDPQPFHIDPEAAQRSIFGGVIASGLHTLLVTYRLFDRLKLLGEQGIAGLGYKDLQFVSPVRPGDELRVHVTVTDKRPTQRGDRGIVSFLLSTLNQDGREVLRLAISILAARRAPAESHDVRADSRDVKPKTANAKERA